MKITLENYITMRMNLYISVSLSTIVWILPIDADVGKQCNFLGFCIGTNTYCDKSRNSYVCRCKPGYPVLIDPHKCLSSKEHGHRCSNTAQCAYYDKKSYCNQLSYQSLCECLSSSIYDAGLHRCVERKSVSNSKPSNMVLPTVVGIALGCASLLCCCLVIVHFFRRSHQQRAGNRPVSTGWSSLLQYRNANRNITSPENAVEHSVNQNDPLPSYEIALSQQPGDTGDPDEPPPCYDEVMKYSDLEDKGKHT